MASTCSSASGPVGIDAGSGLATAPSIDTAETDDGGPHDEFDSWFDTVERCGYTCRTVRGGVVNTGDETKQGVTATVRIGVDDDVIWSETLSFGTLAPGEGDERLRRVQVGVLDGARIKLNDGRVTVSTVVEWDSGRTVYERTVQVT